MPARRGPARPRLGTRPCRAHLRLRRRRRGRWLAPCALPLRDERRDTGHAAETSFGAHIFNTAITWRGEPQSYAGRPPGLSTRLFLRLGQEQHDTFCHLIYPVSSTWNESSETELILHDSDGRELARERVRIPRSGSVFLQVSDVFPGKSGAYAVIRDTTCRLFGYHGLIDREGRFSLDHMFGF
jgi:hypothetical protein